MSGPTHAIAGGHGAPGLPERYRSLRLLARGGMGSVWCAEDQVLGRRVAIKVLAEAFTNDDRARRRFMREARAAARLSGHPHVVTTFDVGDCDERGGGPYIVMEYLAGGTVADAIKLGAFTRTQALRWIDEAAGALDHAHERGVVHRDVKPANMLLGNDRVLRLADFGIASLGSEQTLSGTGQLFGTAAYISPEQAVGRPATAASDRYALAVAAFELVTGTRPFDGEHFTAQARAHIEDPPPHASDRAAELPRAVDAVLLRGMAKDPDERWPSARSFAAGLRQALSQEPGARARRAAAARASAARAARAGSAGAASPAAARVSEPELRKPPLVIFDSIASAGLSRRHGRALALSALALVALALGALVGAGGSGGPQRARSALNAGVVKLSAPKPAHTPPRPAAKPAPATTTTAAPATTTTAAQASPSATTLEAQGHALMEGGAYAAALPVLREAVASAPPDTLTYAYALYDLGRTLRLAGDPQAAIPILQQRLQIPNQPAAVRQELVLAQRAAGAAAGGATGTTPPGPGTGGAGLPGGAPAPTPPGHGDGHGGGHAYGHDHQQSQQNFQQWQSAVSLLLSTGD